MLNDQASPATGLRRRFEGFVRSHLASRPEVVGVVVVGSVATGEARPDSDVDAYIFCSPVNPWIVPAESIWRACDDTFHSIFADESGLEREGLQLDLHRIDLTQWQRRKEWPDRVRAELAEGRVVFDRGPIASLITDRTTMAPGERVQRVDDALIRASGLIPEDPTATWGRLTAAEAIDQLQAGYESLAELILAERGRWVPYRGRLLRVLRGLDPPPAVPGDSWDEAVHQVTRDAVGHERRARVLRAALGALVTRLESQPPWRAGAVTSAFRRLHDEPGRAWNMDEWNARRASLPEVPAPPQ